MWTCSVLGLKDTQDCAGYDCLKAYVEREEPAYQWRDLGHRLEVPDYEGAGGWLGYVLNFTSQQWLSPDIGQADLQLELVFYICCSGQV